MSFHSPLNKNSGGDKSSSSKTSTDSSSSTKNSFQNAIITNRREYIMYLQRTIGNRAVEHLWKSGYLQRKLGINISNNIHEQQSNESDSARTVMGVMSKQKMIFRF
ncbi:MAG: hypothetical protein ABUK01_10400 [Leptospirales bacterium]